MIAADFLRRVLEKLLYEMHTVLTDNGGQFIYYTTTLVISKWAFGAGPRLAKPVHSRMNGPVEHFNCALEEVTVQRCHCEFTTQPNGHLQTFLLTCNHAERRKRLRNLTPHEFVCVQWQKNPVIFT